MRICLITEEFPAQSLPDSESAYMTGLARGLDALGHEVTVICARSKNSENNGKISVVIASPSKRITELQLVRRTMPKSVSYAAELLGFWQAYCQTGTGFDVVEASESLCGALLSAFSRETPTVMRIAGNKEAAVDRCSENRNFDDRFSGLICDYAFACVDVFSCASSRQAEHIQPLRRLDVQQVAINGAVVDSELATTAAGIYEIAIERFRSLRKPHLYRHGAQRLIKSTEDMITLYDRMLYDLLFRVSYTFRVGHWLRMLRSNPETFKVKLLERFSQKV